MAKQNTLATDARKILETGTFDSVAVRGQVIICKRSYFYHHGASAEGLQRVAINLLANNGISVRETECNDKWKNWPATSYMEVRLTPVNLAGLTSGELQQKINSIDAMMV